MMALGSACSWLVPLDGIFCEEGSTCPSDAATTPAADGNAGPPLELLYATGEPALSSRRIRLHLKLINRSKEDVRLADVEVRYHFSSEGHLLTFQCNFVEEGLAPARCDNVRATFERQANPTATANHYLSLRFTADSGSLAPFGGASAEMKLGILPDTGTFDQSNDHSFDRERGETLAPWERMTVYLGDRLVFGTEP